MYVPETIIPQKLQTIVFLAGDIVALTLMAEVQPLELKWFWRI
jgi:hypothetical protein